MAHISADLSRTADGDVQILGSDGTSLLSVSAGGAAKVDGSAVTQPVSAAALPLPTGASTSALQTTGNTSLSSIDSKLGSLGQKTMAGSAPVVIASDQSALPVTVSGGQRTEAQQAAIDGVAFSLVTTTINAQSAGANIIYINNPNTNTKSMVITSIFLGVNAAKSGWGDFTIYANPTVTANGTALTPRNLRIGSATTSVLSAFSGPTTSATGTPVFFWSTSQGVTTSNFIQMNPYIILTPNNKLLLFCTSKANNNPTDIVINWFEAAV